MTAIRITEGIHGHFGTTAASHLTTERISRSQSTGASGIGPRMYRPSLEELVYGALAGQRASVHYVDTFRYPSFGGFMTYLEAFAKRFELRLGHQLSGLDPEARVLRFANGVSVSYDRVISSMPRPELIPFIDGVPRDVLDASRQRSSTTPVL